MAINHINIGAAANDKTGTPARQAGQIINENFDYLDSKISNVNKIITSGTSVLVGQNLTIHVGWVWEINGQQFFNPEDVIVNFPYAATGKQRLDRVVFNTSNTFTRVVGAESVSNPFAERVPDDTIDFGISLVTDNSVGDPSTPIIGDVYVQKNESQDYVVSYGAATVVEQINLIDNRLSVSITGAITDVKSVQLSSEFIRPGKPHYFKNRTNHNVKIWHNAGTGNIKYFFSNGLDLIVKPNEVIEFNLNSNDSSNVKFEFVGILLTDFLTQSTDQNVTGIKTFLAGKFALRNIANTFTSFFTNSNTASRTYTLQNRDGTLLDNTDLSAINSSIATKQTLFTGVQNFIVKSLNATTLLSSRLFDDGSFFGIGTVNTPTKDLTLGNQSDREIAIEDSDSLTRGRHLTVKAGRTVNFDLNVNFLLQSTTGIFGPFALAGHVNGNTYLVSANGASGGIWVQNGGSGSFTLTNAMTSPQLTAITCLPNGSCYISSAVDIYRQSAPNAAITPLLTGLTGVVRLASDINNNIYAISGGTIYKRTNDTGAFVAMSITARVYSAICCASNGDNYASVSSGDIYRQAGGVGDFMALSQSSLGWNSLCATPNGNIYASLTGTNVLYVRTGGTGNFVPMSGTAKIWNQIGAALDNSVYGSAANEVYKQTNAGAGTSNLNGGNLKLKSGGGKGTGVNRVEIYTGQKTVSGTNLQVDVLRVYFDENGYMIWVNMPVFADNTSALAAGLPVGTEYKTATGDRKIVY
ncbi:hypothetical protein [Flavobacterium sp. SLB02]|uniref:hypothetical protein n=1 Tax=Flavobacterium sp. SLB02 TaxID=2665645 RepID=UPI0012A7E834|nr:hypothetical protein [Flavobacterium sp. SLB02]QGK72853.1 hypothetical protein GIY83_01830 [Flavobacterium sp. SLB02]